MASPRKRQRPTEFDDFSTLPSPAQSPVKAKIQGMITSLSPIKHLEQKHTSGATSSTSTEFYSGTINDGIKKVRLIGFNKDQQSKLSEFHKAKQPVTFNNCTISKTKDGTDIQIVVGDFTDIEKSDKTFTITDWSSIGPTEHIISTKVKELQNLPQFQRVTIEAAKVMQVDEVTSLDDGRQCQNVVIADSTGNTRLTLWQSHVNCVELHKTYKLINMTVNTFANKNYIYTSRDNAVIQPTDHELSDIASETFYYPQSTTTTLSNAMIIAIPSFISQKLCLTPSCDGHIIPESSKIGRCSICKMAQRLNMCKHQLSAKLQILSGTTKVQLFAYQQILTKMTELPPEMITEDALLNTETFTVSYNNRMIITSVSK